MGVEAEPAEEQLVLLAKNGNLDAFNSLVDRYQGQVFNLCYRLLSNREAAEDAAQETFLSAFRALSRFEGTSLKSWILRIAANECRDELRRGRRRPNAVASFGQTKDDEPALDIADPGPAVDTLAERQELGVEVERLLARLPFEQRQAIVLVDLFEFRYEEVATMTSTSIGTIKSRIHRGRERLRALVLAQPELFQVSGRLADWDEK